MPDVVLLAAGLGTRLRPLTLDRPKSMIAVAGEPLIHHLLAELGGLGVKRAVLVVGHGKDNLQTYVGDGKRHGVEVTFVTQAKQLGPGHALLQAKPHLTGNEFLLLPADAWYAPEVLAGLLKASGPTALQVADARSTRHGIPVVKAGRLVDVLDDGAQTNPLGGAYRLPRSILDRLAGGGTLTEAIRAEVREAGGWGLQSVPAAAYVDVWEAEDILRLHDRLLEDLVPGNHGRLEPGVHVSGPVAIGKGTIVRSGTVIQGPVTIGDNCDIGPGSILLPGTALRNHVRVGPVSVLSQCIIGSNVEVASHCRVHRAYVDRGARLLPSAYIAGGKGTLVGADAVLGAHSRLDEDARIGANATVAAGRAVRTVPDHGNAV